MIGDAFLIAKRSAVVLIDGIRFPITAGVTRWAKDSPELRQPEIAALFGVQPTGAFAAARSRDWLAPPSPKRDWLAAPEPQPYSTSVTRVVSTPTRIRLDQKQGGTHNDPSPSIEEPT